MKNKTEKKIKNYKIKVILKTLETAIVIPFVIAGGMLFGFIYMPFYLSGIIIKDIWRKDYEI
jgi:hypothetical protein